MVDVLCARLRIHFIIVTVTVGLAIQMSSLVRQTFSAYFLSSSIYKRNTHTNREREKEFPSLNFDSF